MSDSAAARGPCDFASPRVNRGRRVLKSAAEVDDRAAIPAVCRDGGGWLTLEKSRVRRMNAADAAEYCEAGMLTDFSARRRRCDVGGGHWTVTRAVRRP
jgi:hypothetical protein